MNYLKTVKLSVILIFPLLLWGCFEDHASQFHLDDINQVEWAPPNRASSALSYTANLDADQTEPKTVSLEVQLIGAQSGSDRSVGVAVADGDAAEGTHIEILNSNNQVVIPANSNHGIVEVQIIAENIGNGRDFFAQLELQDGDELQAAANLKDMALSIDKDEVSFSTDFELGGAGDPSGSSDLTGLSIPDELSAELSVENFTPNATFDWQVHYNTCNDGADVVGNAGDYPAFQTNADGAGSAEAELDERIFQADQYHLRIQNNLGLEVGCADYES